MKKSYLAGKTCLLFLLPELLVVSPGTSLTSFVLIEGKLRFGIGRQYILLTILTTFLIKGLRGFWASATNDRKDRCVSTKGKKVEEGLWEL